MSDPVAIPRDERSEPVALEDIELDPVAQLVTTTAATADIALRTLASTIVAGTIAPFALRADLGAEQERLAFYADLTDRGDATTSFVAPDGPPPDVVAKRTPAIMAGRRRGRVELLRFPSRYVPHLPELRDEWAEEGPNATMWAQHWRHKDGPRPTLLVCHGFMGSPYLLNSAFFSLPWFYSHGYDVALVTLPFHDRRRQPRCSYSGAGLFAGGVAHMNEAMFQAVHDIRSLVNHLEDQGVPRVGMTGLSLGGYTTGMMAAAEPRLSFAVPNCAVVDLRAIIDLWWPAGALMDKALRRAGTDEETLHAAMLSHSPLTYPAAVDEERLFIVHGLGDRLAPPRQGTSLWEHWNRPKIHWFPGNHTLHVNREAYLRRMGRFFNDLDFGA